MKDEIEKLLGEKFIILELKGSGACNDAFYVETKSGKKFIVKRAKANKDFTPQNTLSVEAGLIKELSGVGLSIPTPKICFVSDHSEMFAYEYMEGDLLINVWKDLSEEERLKVCKRLGEFHAELGQKVSKELAQKCRVKINESLGLHPEVEKDYWEIIQRKDVPAEFIELAKQAKLVFDQTLDFGVFQFLHNDSHHENILVKGAEVVGIIDFGESEFGEIAKEFSRYIRDFPNHAEYIVEAYEKASGHKLLRERLISNAFLSGLIDNVNDYLEGGEARQRAIRAIQAYELMFSRLK